jgi:hypothetical protein
MVREHGEKKGNETIEEIGAARTEEPRHTTNEDELSVLRTCEKQTSRIKQAGREARGLEGNRRQEKK